MTMYYLDIETTGLDEIHDKIITIQYQELERETGRPVGDLTILEEWEVGEYHILEQLSSLTPIHGDHPFAFVPVGYNLMFEHKFLQSKTSFYNLPEIDLLSRPHIDLHGTGILMNQGEFKGSGLDKLTDKRCSGANVPSWYAFKDYDSIEIYIRDETRAFVEWFAWLLRRMPAIREEWNRERARSLWNGRLDDYVGPGTP